MNFNISKNGGMRDEAGPELNVSEKRDACVWYCRNCAKFHIKAGEVLLTFDKEEFADFSNSVFDCLSSAVTIDDIRHSAPAALLSPDAFMMGIVPQSR